MAADDYTADLTTTGLFAVTSSGASSYIAEADGTFEAEGDKDWIKFVPQSLANPLGAAAAAYTYTLSAKDASGVALSATACTVHLLNASGKVPIKVGNGSVLKITSLADWYLQVVDNAKVAGTGTYSLSIESVIADDYGKTVATASTLTLDSTGAGSTTGTIEVAKDVDWIKLGGLTANAGYAISVNALGGAPVENYSVTLLDAAGKAIKGMVDTADAGASWLAYGNGTASAIHVVVTGGKSGTVFDTGSYTLTVESISDDATASTATTAAAAVDDAFVGMLDWSGDVDWVKIDAPTGTAQECRVLVAGYDVKNWALKLYDAAGLATTYKTKWAADPDDSSVRLCSVDLQPGFSTLYAAVSSTKSEQGVYTVDLLTDDYSANTSTLLAAQGDTATGFTIDGTWAWKGDKDWARLDLSSLTGTGSFEITDAINDFDGTRLALYDAAGKAVRASTLTTAHTFSLKAGVYYLQVENTSADYIGDYQLEVTLVGVV